MGISRLSVPSLMANHAGSPSIKTPAWACVLSVAFDLHQDFDDGVVVSTVPKAVLLRHSEGEGHVLLTLLNTGELVGPHFGTASEDGDVEVLAVVVAGAVVVAVGPVTTHIDLEIATEFTVFFHEECLLQVRLHAESQIDVDEAVVLFFSEFAFSRGFLVAGVEVGPGVGESIVEEVHRGVVGVGLDAGLLAVLVGLKHRPLARERAAWRRGTTQSRRCDAW